MNTTEKGIIVGLGLVVAIGLFAGTAFGLVGQTSTGSQRGVGGMMWGGSGYGGGGLTGLGASTATSSQSHPGGMMGGMWGMMGNNGLATDGRNIMMGCFQYMAHILGLGANETTS